MTEIYAKSLRGPQLIRIGKRDPIGLNALYHGETLQLAFELSGQKLEGRFFLASDSLKSKSPFGGTLRGVDLNNSLQMLLSCYFSELHFKYIS